MELLGNYASNLTAFLYAQLLAQLESSISQGEYSAGTLFDTAAAQTIQQEGQNFSNITLPSAGNTAYAEDVNNPLDSLQARFTAILNEVAAVQNEVPQLLNVIAKESSLLDKTIAAASGEAWASQQPFLPTAQSFQWNFAAGNGITSTNYPNSGYQEDPYTAVVYTASVPEVSYIINEYFTPPGSGAIVDGIGSPIIPRTIPVNSVEWTFAPNSSQTQYETIYGNDQSWAYLSTLEPNPILLFGPPTISTILPIGGSSTGLFTASGSVPGGSLPIYVRILFYPRQKTLQITNATGGQVIQLSAYNVTADTVEVYTNTTTYKNGIDFTVSTTAPIFTVAETGGLVGLSFTILFEEYYPAYQSSIDQTNWSPIFMLDANRPYPDDTTDFLPIYVQNGNFPLMDELGASLGLYLQMVGVPTAEMELLVTTPGSTTYGENAQLTISLERAVYMSGLQLSPFTNFPTVIQQITAVGFTDNIQNTVLDIPVLLDHEATMLFPRQLVRKFIINFYQQNYALKQYIVEPPDALRRDTLANLQATLPFSVQQPAPAQPQFFEGALYEFGVQNILGIDNQYSNPGVFSSGPYTVIGMPEVIRLDTLLQNMPQSPTPAVYIAYISYNANDIALEQNEIVWPYNFSTSGCIAYPGIYKADYVEFFIKLVFRQPLSIAQQILLQVTTT